MEPLVVLSVPWVLSVQEVPQPQLYVPLVLLLQALVSLHQLPAKMHKQIVTFVLLDTELHHVCNVLQVLTVLEVA